MKKTIVTLGTMISFGFCAVPYDSAAQPVSTHWSTYLRSGPGEAYPVLGELEHDTLVDLQACQDGWCRISQGRFAGYIDRQALSLPQPPHGQAPPPHATCFGAGLTSYNIVAPRRFCEDSAPAPAKAR